LYSDHFHFLPPPSFLINKTFIYRWHIVSYGF